MNRPDNILAYDEMDLKLGIKSSLPHVKSTLALAILLWECSDHPAELIYSEQNGDETVMASQLEQWVIDYLADICEEEHISPDDLINGLNQNQLFKSQMEALMVAFGNLQRSILLILQKQQARREPAEFVFQRNSPILLTSILSIAS